MSLFFLVGLRYAERDGQKVLQYGSQQKTLKADPSTGEVYVAGGELPEWHDIPTVELAKE